MEQWIGMIIRSRSGKMNVSIIHTVYDMIRVMDQGRNGAWSNG